MVGFEGSKTQGARYSCVVISISDQPFSKRHVHTPYFVFLIWIVKIRFIFKIC